MNSKLLNTKQAAEFLGVSPAWLEKSRWMGAGVPFVRLGGRAIRYRQEDLDAFVKSKLSTSTSAYGATPQAMSA